MEKENLEYELDKIEDEIVNLKTMLLSPNINYFDNNEIKILKIIYYKLKQIEIKLFEQLENLEN